MTKSIPARAWFGAGVLAVLTLPSIMPAQNTVPDAPAACLRRVASSLSCEPMTAIGSTSSRASSPT